MTQMTLMTLNPGYGIGISSKQRHKRHQRHYRHARMLPGVWGTPQKMRLWISKRYACKTRPHPKTIAPNPYTHTNPYIPQSESAVIHPKILTRKSESVLIHSEKISQITVLSHSYIIHNCKTNSRNIQKPSRICQTESSKCGIGIWTRS